MGEHIDIRKYSFSGEEKLFFDTNIWYLIYGPKPIRDDSQYQLTILRKRFYSDAFKRIQENNCIIYTDSLIISEFINIYAKAILERYNWRLPANSKKRLKDYRKTDDFKSKVEIIISETKKIFKNSKKENVDLESMDFDFYLLEYKKCKLDFNDIIYSDICTKKEFTLVTDDKDFKDYSGKILTANNELL
jgi:predicted nucleic acid-binding protein